MPKGLALPFVIIFIVLFLSLPIGFYFYVVKASSVDTTGLVKGISSDLTSKPGVNIVVSSKGGAWDLHQFLCDDRTACLKSLTIGKPWGIVSGGVTQSYFFNIDPSQNWGSGFKYMKIFAKSSWGSMIRVFNVSFSSSQELVETVVVNSEGVDYNVILIPLENIKTDSSIMLEFSDY